MMYFLLFGLISIFFIFLAIKFIEMTFYKSKYEEANPTQQSHLEENVAKEGEKLFDIIKYKVEEFWNRNKTKIFGDKS